MPDASGPSPRQSQQHSEDDEPLISDHSAEGEGVIVINSEVWVNIKPKHLPTYQTVSISTMFIGASCRPQALSKFTCFGVLVRAEKNHYFLGINISLRNAAISDD